MQQHYYPTTLYTPNHAILLKRSAYGLGEDIQGREIANHSSPYISLKILNRNPPKGTSGGIVDFEMEVVAKDDSFITFGNSTQFLPVWVKAFDAQTGVAIASQKSTIENGIIDRWWGGGKTTINLQIDTTKVKGTQVVFQALIDFSGGQGTEWIKATSAPYDVKIALIRPKGVGSTDTSFLPDFSEVGTYAKYAVIACIVGAGLYVAYPFLRVATPVAISGAKAAGRGLKAAHDAVKAKTEGA